MWEFAYISGKFVTFYRTIPQSASLTAPFAQGGLWRVRRFEQLYKLKFEHREETEVCAREEAQQENGEIIVCKLRFAQDGDIEIVRNA